MAAALAAYGGEPGGFRTGLFLGEAAAGVATALPPVLLGFAVIAEGEDETGKAFWLGAAVMGSYPFAMTLGIMGVGERVGAPSSNPGTAYLVPTAATLAGAAASAALGNAIFRDYDARSRVALGLWCGLFPNAFLNAYVYNRVKKPEADAASSRISATPYVTAYRVGRDEPTPVYGLTLSF
ncbi:MAG: hypothetical protein V3W11_00400 [bacterium]